MVISLRIFAIVLTLSSLCAVSTSNAEVLVRYQFGVTGQETAAETGAGYLPTVISGSASATPISDPLNTIGIEVSSAATTPASAPFLRVDPQGNSTSAANAITNNKYFEFTLSPVGNIEFDLTSLTFDAARGGDGTPRGYVVRTSLDGFASNLAQADLTTVRPNFTAVTIDLSPFANTSAPVVFRIYSYSPLVATPLTMTISR